VQLPTEKAIPCGSSPSRPIMARRTADDNRKRARRVTNIGRAEASVRERVQSRDMNIAAWIRPNFATVNPVVIWGLCVLCALLFFISSRRRP
jgi:hypothetical protein